MPALTKRDIPNALTLLRLVLAALTITLLSLWQPPASGVPISLVVSISVKLRPDAVPVKLVMTDSAVTVPAESEAEVFTGG